MRVTVLFLALASLLTFPSYSWSASPETHVLGVRWATEGPVGKVLIDFDNAVNYRTAASGSSIVVDLWPAQLVQWPSLEIGHPYVRHVWVNQIAENLTRIRVDLVQPARYKTFLKTNPHHLVVLVIPPWLATAGLPASLSYEKQRVATAAGFTTVHVLRVDPRDPKVEIRPVLAANTMTGYEATSIIATSNDALAAINGGYFAGAGIPVGMVVIDGELVSVPVNRRSVFAITRQGQPIIETFEFQGFIFTPDNGSLWVSSVNQPPAPGGLAIYTRHYGPLIPPHALAAVVRRDIVESLTWGRSMIPDDGYVITVAGKDTDLIAKHLRPGQRLRVSLHLTPNVEVVSALGGGPRLVKDGKEFIPFAWEWFTPHFYAIRTARTAVGITGTGKLLFVTVDARNRHHTGMTLHELAQLLIRLGARDAMNLDGGGSATMVVGGRLVNVPSDGYERPIASSLVILRRAAR